MPEQLITRPPEQTELSQATVSDQLHQELATTVKYMERLHASEVFTTPVQSKEFLDSLNYDEFKRWISFINGIELGIPKSERGQVSESYVQSESLLRGTGVVYRPPHKVFRDRLLRMAFEKAQLVDDPEIAGLTLGLSINAIHYFGDGNGRTARLTFALLSRGYNGSLENQEYYSSLLENTKGREIVNPNPAISGVDRKIRSEMFGRIQEKSGYKEAFGDRMPTYVHDGYNQAMVDECSPQELAVSDEINAQGRLMLYNTMESGGMEMISLMATFGPDRIKDFVRTSTDGSHTMVDGNKFLPTLTLEEIQKWWKNSNKAVATYVRHIINIADRDDVAEITERYKTSVV